MASLANQSIASSYDQLLHVDNANGGDTTNLVQVKDGNNDTTFALKLSTTTVCVNNPTASAADQGGVLRLQSDDGAVMASGHRLGVIEFGGAEDTSNTITVGARIEAITDATWSASENGADMVFYTTDADASQSEVMRLTADGNVGIGAETAPSADLHVKDASGQAQILIECAAGNDSILSFHEDGVAKAYFLMDGTNDNLEFWVGGSERMQITSGGNIGIGQTNPQNIIHASVADGNNDTFIARFDNSDTDEPLGIDIRFPGITSGTGTNDNDYYIVARDMSGGSLTTRFRIDGEGDVETVSGDDIAAISDERLKENIADYTGGLAIINALKPRTFTWKNNVDRGQAGTRYGFIAQEVMNVAGYQENMRLAKKGSIHDETDHDAVKALCSDGVLYKSQLSAKECILISAIKELSAKVTALESA